MELWGNSVGNRKKGNLNNNIGANNISMDLNNREIFGSRLITHTVEEIFT